MKSIAGRKAIHSARQLKARVLVHLRATEHDVASNSEIVRLMDMIERMREEGSLIPFYLEALKGKLRSDEIQSAEQVVNEVIVLSPPPQQLTGAVQSVAVPSPLPQQQKYVDTRVTDRVQPQLAPAQIIPSQNRTPGPVNTVVHQQQEAFQSEDARVYEPKPAPGAQPAAEIVPHHVPVRSEEPVAAPIHQAAPEGARAPSEIIASVMERIGDVRDGSGNSESQPPPIRRMKGNGLRAMG